MKYLPQILIIVLLFSFTSCKKNSTGSGGSEYIDVDLIYIVEKTTWDEEEPDGSIITIRRVVGYYLGPINNLRPMPNSFYEDGVDSFRLAFLSCKWIRYYKNDSYIEFEKTVSDGQTESLDVSGRLVYYAITN